MLTELPLTYMIMIQNGVAFIKKILYIHVNVQIEWKVFLSLILILKSDSLQLGLIDMLSYHFSAILLRHSVIQK